MADDTRQPPSGPRPSANIMPGGTAHTAGGSSGAEPVDVLAAAKSIRWADWASLPSKPCVKDSLLTGMGAGFALGGVRAVARGPVISACNWAVGGFCFAAFGAYQYCGYQRRVEREGMRQAIEIIDRKGIERRQKEQRMERARELRRQKKDHEDQEAFARLRAEKEQQQQQQQPQQGKSWWKVW